MHGNISHSGLGRFTEWRGIRREAVKFHDDRHRDDDGPAKTSDDRCEHRQGRQKDISVHNEYTIARDNG